MDKVNRKNSRAVLMLNKYQISIQKLCIVFQRYKKEFNEDIKLRYIVVLGGGSDDASILCIWLKWNLN
jgi:hypothetical protein